MKLEVLMSVMHQKDFTLAYKSKIDSDLLIINQCDEEGYREIMVNGHKWRMISTKERGLSKSRNMALKNALGDICLLSDDDEEFTTGYKDNILRAYQETPQATAIVFNVKRINTRAKKKYYRITEVREAPSYRAYQSGMFSFRRKVIIDAKIKFNEKFGSGSQWGGGEETLFQGNMRRLGYKIYENPYQIAVLDYGGGSKWFKGYNEKYFYNLGAYSYYANNYKLTLRTIARMIYESFYKLRKEKYLSPFGKILWMLRGMRGMKKNITFDEAGYVAGDAFSDTKE